MLNAYRKLALAAFLIAFAGEANAQIADSTSIQAANDGQIAARAQPLGSFPMASFAGGFTIGLLSMTLLSPESVEGPLLAAGGLIGIAFASSRAKAASAEVPAEIGAQIANRDARYQAAFKDAYLKEINWRRQKTTFGAAALGAVVGFLALMSAIPGT